MWMQILSVEQALEFPGLPWSSLEFPGAPWTFPGLHVLSYEMIGYCDAASKKARNLG
jgi:hypothetical protein